MDKELRLDINGRKDGHGYLIQINDKAMHLSAAPFKMLVILALERVRKDSDGWVQTKELAHPPDNAARYMYPLRKAINEALGLSGDDKWIVAWGDKKGLYRLDIDPSMIKFTDLAALIAFEDHAITKRISGPGRVL